jgi:hypothetical protein
MASRCRIRTALQSFERRGRDSDMLLFAVNKKESPAAGFVEFTLDGSTLLTVPDASTLLGVPEQSRRERSRKARSEGLSMRVPFFTSLLN